MKKGKEKISESVQARNTVYSIYLALSQDKVRNLSRFDRFNNILLYFSLLKSYRKSIPNKEFSKLKSVLNNELNDLLALV